MITAECWIIDEGRGITKDKLCDSDRIPSSGFCFQRKQPPKNKLGVSDRVPCRGFCFPGEYTIEKKLCVSGRVPSRGFCFPGKHTRKISYAFLIAFLAGAFVFHQHTTQKKALRL